MASPVGVDLELKKAFQELQAKMMLTTEKLKMADIHIESLKRMIHHTQLTDKEIFSLPPGTRMYESLGRMFVGTNRDEVKKSLDNKIKTSQDRIKQNETNKAYLEKDMKESEDNLREMIAHKQKGR